MKQSELIVLIGNIGSGKSTLSKKYAKDGYYIVCRDTMREMLGAGTYIFKPESEQVIHSTSINMLKLLLITGKNILIDETNMSSKTRKLYIEIGKENGYSITAICTPKLSKEQCLKNREKDSLRGTELKTWDSVWEQFNKRYEEPNLDEGFDNIIIYENQEEMKCA